MPGTRVPRTVLGSLLATGATTADFDVRGTLCHECNLMLKESGKEHATA